MTGPSDTERSVIRPVDLRSKTSFVFVFVFPHCQIICTCTPAFHCPPLHARARPENHSGESGVIGNFRFMPPESP